MQILVMFLEKVKHYISLIMRPSKTLALLTIRQILHTLLVTLRCILLDKKMDWTHCLQSIDGTVNKTHVIHLFSPQKARFLL